MSILSQAIKSRFYRSDRLPKRRTIEINPGGRLGNQMLQYLLARVIQYEVPDAQITGFHLPEFGLYGPKASGEPFDFNITSHVFDFDKAIQILRDSDSAKVGITGLSLRMEYFADHLDMARKAFSTNPSLKKGFGEGHLVINIRLGDILAPNIHANYRPLPVAYYERLISESGKTPVFLGEISDDPYSDELKKRFQGATFISNKSPMDDFNMLRTSSNIVLSISTFSWFAGWLSETANQILLPVSGFLNPEERPDINAIPINDGRYQFDYFPVEKWSGSPEQLQEKIFGRDTSSRRNPAQVA